MTLDAFTCPDMIGGGEFTSFLEGTTIDEELFVRSAQVHALMPMMQFSVAPWRILNRGNNDICRSMAELQVRHADTLLGRRGRKARPGLPCLSSVRRACNARTTLRITVCRPRGP